MSTTQTYKVISNNAPVKNKTSLFASTLGRLKKGTTIEVISISGIWAYFKYNNKNAYILTYYIEKVETVITGSITIKYIDKDTSLSIAESKVYENLELGTYSYDALDILGYKISGESTKSTSISKYSPNQSISFEYSQILGTVTIKYLDIDENIEIAESDVYPDLAIGEHTYSAKSISGYVLSSTDTQTVTLTYDDFVQVLVFKYKKDTSGNPIYTIDLEKYNISNDNTNATSTTKGINQALVDAKAAGYKRVKLPEGHYSLSTDLNLAPDKNSGYGIKMLSDMELILNDCILQMLPCEDPAYSILTISSCKNSKITGGTILGDRELHNYGMRINENKDVFESGDLDSITGEPKDDNSMVRTKNYISIYKDYFTNQEESIPNSFYIIPLWNTTMNTVDGGCRYIYCYDSNNKYLGLTEGGIGYIRQATLLPNTSKIKISLKNEKRLDVVLSMTKRTLWYTYEFGSGITISDSNNIEINGVTVKDCIGDCICTNGNDLVELNNLSIINCTLENSRRQGISFTSFGSNYLVKDCNIGKINGTDPQCGIDFETGGEVGKTYDIIIDNCNFYDNKKWDIINYDGFIIEVKNSQFTGAIADTFGSNMTVHDNKFHYKNSENNDKIYVNVCLNLSNKNNIVFNNEFISGSVANSGIDSKTYDNIFKNTTVLIQSDYVNNYYNSSIEIDTNLISNLSNNYFEDCEITTKYNSSVEMLITNCTFENSSIAPRGICKINNSIFNLTDSNLMNGWMIDETKILYNNCSITSNYTQDIQLLGSALKTNATFEYCKFNISRYTLALSYGSLTFNNCDFIFNNLNTDENSIDLNKSGYGYQRCPWYFNDCYFQSALPIIIYGSNVNNPTISGNITYS